MGVNRYNAEGYCDPTAYEAIRNSERFRISYPTGYMELNVENFFPCPVEKGKKVFRLVREHCTVIQQEELLAVLLRKAKSYATRLSNWIADWMTRRFLKRIMTMFIRSSRMSNGSTSALLEILNSSRGGHINDIG
jgi:hypothetical protein